MIMHAGPRPHDLERAAEDLLEALARAGHEHRIVIVHDGCGRTAEIVETLTVRHPGRLLAVRHEGEADAAAAGVQAALERTEMRRIVLVGAGGAGERAPAADLPALLRAQRDERADVVIGRAGRAAPRARLTGGPPGRLLSDLRDPGPSCPYRLFDRWLLEEPHGPAPGCARDRLRVVEHPLTDHGERAPDGPPARRAFSIPPARLRPGRRPWSPAMRLLRPEDRTLALLTMAAVVLSALAFAYHWRLGSVLAYNDSGSHLLIARRVIDSPTPGLAQLGGVWPPLPHLLVLPFVWHDGLFYSGLAGALISMISYVVAVRYLYRLATDMAGTGGARARAAGITAAGLFALNPNVLYLQSTPMTELLLFACVAAAVYHLHVWCRTARHTQLAIASAAALLATLTRYEGWVLAVAMTAVVGYVSFRRRRDLARVEAHLIFFGMAAFAGIVGWALWSRVIFGDWLYWHSGEYAKPSLWVSPDDANVGAPAVAWRTYGHAMLHDLGALTLATGAAGVLAYAWRRRLRAEAPAPYILLIFVPFFAQALTMGQRPLHVPEVHGSFYNVRFGLVMAMAAAVFTGYLLSLAPLRTRSGARSGTWFGTRLGSRLGAWFGFRFRAGWERSVLVGCALSTVLAVPGTATLTEPMNWHAGRDERAVARAVDLLRRGYDGGLLLMENHGNETVTFGSRIPLGRIVYEGSFRVWDRALKDPAGQGIRWIYARTLAGRDDRTWRALRDLPALTRDFTLVYQDEVQHIYRRRP
ncbi:glycosyltransferase family 39 protein [Nonomuraea candida]|uniref:glycosyltransferase family 39 protein n=1 Tax=Nonomuraea candida TaxID=359159 RepID=UPI0014701CB7